MDSTTSDLICSIRSASGIPSGSVENQSLYFSKSVCIAKSLSTSLIPFSRKSIFPSGLWFSVHQFAYSSIILRSSTVCLDLISSIRESLSSTRRLIFLPRKNLVVNHVVIAEKDAKAMSHHSQQAQQIGFQYSISSSYQTSFIRAIRKLFCLTIAIIPGILGAKRKIFADSEIKTRVRQTSHYYTRRTG